MSQDADDDEVKRAYRKAALKTHPDKVGLRLGGRARDNGLVSVAMWMAGCSPTAPPNGLPVPPITGPSAGNRGKPGRGVQAVQAGGRGICRAERPSPATPI